VGRDPPARAARRPYHRAHFVADRRSGGRANGGVSSGRNRGGALDDTRRSTVSPKSFPAHRSAGLWSCKSAIAGARRKVEVSRCWTVRGLIGSPRRTKRSLVKRMVEWFLANYEDPVNSTPYDGAEGGYQYQCGGRYSARDEPHAALLCRPASAVDDLEDTKIASTPDAC
jgi:hypothetical protein